jgi:hypothetical protein
MNSFIPLLLRIYSRLLLLYPRSFQNEFAEEMQVVFSESVEEAIHEGTLSFAFVCLKELGGLPFNILREFWHELKGRETVMVTNESTTDTPTREEKMPRGELILGTLPFALYGLVSILTKTEFPFWSAYLSFFIFILLGLLIGVVKGFPRWTYSYLGWSMVMSWYWSMMPIFIQNVYSPVTHNQLWGWRSWIPLLVTLGIGSLVARSLHPLRQLFRGIWQDWTSLTLMMYTFGAFVHLIYDENHHPYLFAFMIGSTLVLSIGAWIFLQNANTWKRIASILSGFIAASFIDTICYANWDAAAYYGLPKDPPEAWYVSARESVAMFAFWSVILFWPALVGLVRSITKGGKTA